jgi:hypothetical protein
MALTKNYQLLSSSNYTVVGSNSLRMYGKYNSQDINRNVSSVTLQLRTIALSGHFTSSGNTSNLTCDGHNRGTQSYNIGTVTTSAETVIGTWTFDIGHNSDGKKTGVSFSASANVYGNLNPSTNGWFDLPSIPRQANITGANNFTDEENAYFTFNNPGGFTIDMWLEPSPVNTHYLRKNIPNTGNYTFEFTEEERKEFRKVASNSNSITVRYGLYTYIGNTTYTSYVDKTMTIVNANPTFNNFNFEDVNEKTLALTGNNQNIIQGYSNVKVTIPEEFIAIANKEATMNKYRFANGDSSVDIVYKESESSSGVINNIKNGVFNVYAIDSRNNSTLITKNAEQVITYNPLLKKNISVSRQNGVSENVNLKFDGSIDLINFGLKENSILNAKYRYMVTGTNTWSDYQDIDVTVSETGEFAFDTLIKGDTEELGFNINNSYNIEVLVEDELSSVTYTATFGSGIPNIALHKNGVGIMGKYDVDEGGLLQVAGKNIFTDFSTEEKRTNSKWKDGKWIYTKTIDLGPIGSFDKEKTFVLDGQYSDVVGIDGKLYHPIKDLKISANQISSPDFFRFLSYEKSEDTSVKIIYNRANASHWNDRNLETTIAYTKFIEEILIDFSSVEKEEISIYSNGSTATHTAWYTYKNVDCSNYKAIKFIDVPCYDYNNIYICGISFYDENNIFIKGIGSNESQEYSEMNNSAGLGLLMSGAWAVPTGAKYIRVAYRSETTALPDLTWNTKIYGQL